MVYDYVCKFMGLVKFSHTLEPDRETPVKRSGNIHPDPDQGSQGSPT